MVNRFVHQYNMQCMTNNVKCPHCEYEFDPEAILINRITESHPKGFHFLYSCPKCLKLLNATFFES